MVECTDIYCKKEARTRLSSTGLSPSKIEEVAEEVFQKVKRIVEKDAEDK